MNILITGGSRGIGKAIAEAFAQNGQPHTIVLCARNKATLTQIADEWSSRFPQTKFLIYATDIAVKEAAQTFGAWALKEVGTIDVLINNAGTFVPGQISSEPDGALETMLAVNLHSAYHLTRAVLPAMIAAKSGHIFNICSIASLQAYPNGGAYSISKFALLGFSKNLREELKPHGIKVTAVMPGAVYTDSWSGSGVPRSRIMEAQDIAKLIYNAAHLSPQANVEEIVVRPQQGDL